MLLFSPGSASMESQKQMTPRTDHREEIEVEESPNNPCEKNYGVGSTLDQLFSAFGRTVVIQCLVQWKKYGPEYYEWRSLTKLTGCLEFIKMYEKLHLTTPSAKQSQVNQWTSYQIGVFFVKLLWLTSKPFNHQ